MHQDLLLCTVRAQALPLLKTLQLEEAELSDLGIVEVAKALQVFKACCVST